MCLLGKKNSTKTWDRKLTNWCDSSTEGQLRSLHWHSWDSKRQLSGMWFCFTVYQKDIWFWKVRPFVQSDGKIQYAESLSPQEGFGKKVGSLGSKVKSRDLETGAQ